MKGFSPRADIQANTFWRLLMPAWPAYLLLFASIPLLVPTLARRLGDRVRPAEPDGRRSRWIAVAAVVTVRRSRRSRSPCRRRSSRRRPSAVVQDFEGGNILTPVDDAVALRVERDGGPGNG